MAQSDLLKFWNIASKLPLGKNLVSQTLCSKIPYFKTIKPKFIQLQPNYCQASMPKTKMVINHLNSIHAIAMCNMAEFTGGTMCEVTIPAHYRWIPTGMQVEYLKKATTDLIAIAMPVIPNQEIKEGQYDVKVELFNTQQDIVFRAIISMKVSAKSKS